jgi:hypothetical protein
MEARHFLETLYLDYSYNDSECNIYVNNYQSSPRKCQVYIYKGTPRPAQSADRAGLELLSTAPRNR